MLRIALLTVTLTLVSSELFGEWAVFKAEFGRHYSVLEDAERREIFAKNLQMIEKHNIKFANGESSFYLGVNQFSDMTWEEIRTKVTNYRKQVELSDIPEPRDVSDLPSEVNWVKEGYVSKVEDQGVCGSCWAFSATGAIEGQHKKVMGELVPLSVSQLVDCSWDWGNNGCYGGFMNYSFEYIIDNRGQQDDESYPYVPEENNCAFDPERVAATISKYEWVEKFSETALQEKVATIGPISVAVSVTDKFLYYKGGVLDDPNCSSIYLDHAVLAVGYGEDDRRRDYWLVKNSWGEYWGANGYIKMSRNKDNQCGIASDGIYPLV